MPPHATVRTSWPRSGARACIRAWLALALIVAAAAAPAADDAAYVAHSWPPRLLESGESRRVAVAMRNTGTTTWTATTVALAPVGGPAWGVERVPLHQATVRPGGLAIFIFDMTAGQTVGPIPYRWRMMRLPTTPFGAEIPASTVEVTPVPPPVDDAECALQFAPTPMVAGEPRTVALSMRNTGTTTWRRGEVVLEPVGSSEWGVTSVPLAAATVRPKGGAAFVFAVTPPKPGTATFQWRLRRVGGGSLGAASPAKAITVTPAPFAAEFVAQALPERMAPGRTYTVGVTMRNTGTSPWSATGALACHLGAQDPTGTTRWGPSRVDLTGDVAPGAIATFAIPVTAPATAGDHVWQWRMVRGESGWFGATTPHAVVTVAEPVGSVAPLRLLTDVLPAARIGAPYEATLTAAGGDGTLAWSLAGSLPPGLAFDPESARITGTPTHVGTATILATVRDATGRKAGQELALTVASNRLAITTTALGLPSVGYDFQQAIRAAGGVAPIRWRLGGRVPPGLAIDADSGVLSGRATEPGRFLVTITAMDANDEEATRGFVLETTGRLPTVVTTALSAGKIGHPYRAELAAADGVGPYRWELIGGALPLGTRLDPVAGVITGTPEAAGWFQPVIAAIDAHGRSWYRPFDLMIADRLRIRTEALNRGSWMPDSWSVTSGQWHLTVTGGYGELDVAWSGLPDDWEGMGLMLRRRLGATGEPGSFTATVTVTDALGERVSRSFDWLARDVSLPMISTRVAEDAVVGWPYLLSLGTMVGAAPTRDRPASVPMTWAITAGSLPPGMWLNRPAVRPTEVAEWVYTQIPSPAIGGIPTAAGTWAFTVTFTDHYGRSAVQDYDLTVHPSDPRFTGNPQLPHAPIDKPYQTSIGFRTSAPQRHLRGAGGHAGWYGTTGDWRWDWMQIVAGSRFAYRWSLAGGRLPAGLALDGGTGAITGTPTEHGAFDVDVMVEDAYGQRDLQRFRLAVPRNPPRITTLALPSGSAGAAYAAQVAITGGEGSDLRWSARGLPTGLAIDQRGIIRGTIADADEVYRKGGEFSVLVTVGYPPDGDEEPIADTRVFRLTVADDRLSFTGIDRVAWVAGRAEGLQLTAAGGDGGYRLRLRPGAELIPGIELQPSGFLAGTPYQPGRYVVPVQLEDAEGSYRLRTYVVEVGLPPMALDGRLPANGEVGQPWHHQFFVQGSGAPGEFRLVEGELPPGLTLRPDGVLEGTPTAPAAAELLIEATDAHGTVRQRTVFLAIKPPPGPAAPAGFGWLPSLGEAGARLALVTTLPEATP